MRPPARHALALLVALAALPGCAAKGAMSPKSVEAEEERLPDDVEGTQAQLDRAEGDLLGAIGPAARRAPLDQASPPPPPSPTEAAPSPESKDETAAAAEAQGGAVQRSPCDIACRALTSMRRATDHLCGLTGDGDPRCASARERVRSADERVRATCPGCGG